jgi:hypothetical protein
MLLYYSTICGLYPSLYCSTIPSSSLSIDLEEDTVLTNHSNCGSMNAEESTIIRKLDSENNSIQPDLETTSEGLCDHVREIFGLSRQVFNDYQVKAMKKLLIRKSHPQVLIYFDRFL